MTPNAYQAAKRLAEDPRTPQGERESAAARVREYEAKHPPRVVASATMSGQAFDDALNDFARRTMACRFVCRSCLGRPGQRNPYNPCACACHPAAERPKPAPPPKAPRTGTIPWWELQVYRSGLGSGLTKQRRYVLRRLKREVDQMGSVRQRMIFNNPGSNTGLTYELSRDTLAALNEGRVDWRWFPERESEMGPAWRPPPEMRAAMKAQRSPR